MTHTRHRHQGGKRKLGSMELDPYEPTPEVVYSEPVLNALLNDY